MLGYPSIDVALDARPPEMVSVAPEVWDLLRLAYDGGARASEFETAWANGRAFLQAPDALRGRRPVIVEWKGSHRAPGDEVAPIDLRVDHVFLVSCKYLSRIMINASPAHLFERLLQGGHGIRGGDWYAEVAPESYQALYESVRPAVPGLPADVTDLRVPDRRALSGALREGWPSGTESLYARLARDVAQATAARWQARLAAGSSPESMLWRILRMGSAPYFVLGASPAAPLLLRVATPWDWRRHYRLVRFAPTAQDGGQPRVGWTAEVEDRHSGETRTIDGHVEVRWSHGRFGGNPEAKVYLDTPHARVPGYFPL